MYVYDIGMNSVLKDHKETIHENLILLKNYTSEEKNNK